MGCIASTQQENKPKTVNISNKKQTVPDEEVDELSSQDISTDEPDPVVRKNNHDKYYLIQILRAEDVPKMDMTSDSDPYVILRVLDKNKKQKGKEIKSLHRLDNHEPIWNCYRTFSACPSNDILKFELWDKDFMVGDKDDFIGAASLKISEVFINIDDHHITSKKSKNKLLYNEIKDDHDEIDDEEEFVQDVAIKFKNKSHTSKFRTKIFFKLIEIKHTPNTIENKTLFLIRHGESQWNSAQDGKNVIKMYKQVDHPLSEEGIKQAINFNKLWKTEKDKFDNANSDAHNKFEDLNDFLKSQIIYSSPLCRATQTALLTLIDHPCMNDRGIKFARNLREIKNVGGADTLANKCGKEQVQKVMDNIFKYIGDDATLKNQISEVNIDCADSDDNQKWWSKSVDTKKHFYKRLNDLMYYLRYSQETNIICVGHSLWIKGFFNRYINKKDIQSYSSKKEVENILDNDVFEKTDKLMKDLKKQKIQNAGCVRVDIAFSDSFENGVKIKDVRLLFGSKLID